MGNRLFQEARRSVELAKQAPAEYQHRAVATAENALSSAYANTTRAEQEQLRHYQNELDTLK
ncbi:DUF3813 domain-containing protein [Mesobacillus harenae]|uniref:DUF3813 domain-containing protein n=1 Tax=Mesobacillus harenae TaxID=2213203 RepID=UPI00157FBE15|nr:DUF3813 domain-containing protein [Mesobacillus harenae]